MKRNLLTSGEALVVQTNIEEIERRLGHKIPVGVVDYSELTTMLTTGEAQTIARNIEKIEQAGGGRYRQNQAPPEPIEWDEGTIVCTIIVIVIAMLIAFFKSL